MNAMPMSARLNRRQGATVDVVMIRYDDRIGAEGVINKP